MMWIKGCFLVLISLTLEIAVTAESTVEPTVSGCKDELDVCGLLDKSYYCIGTFRNWAIANCQRTCSLCGQTIPSTLPTTQGPTTPSDGTCDYNGVQYQQGQSWRDGCKYNCTCEDGSVGDYKCVDLCRKYINVPQACHLVTKHGECCPQPNCPLSGVDIDEHFPFTTKRTACFFKGQYYVQGQTWYDGCSAECTCTDWALGLYSCRGRCLTWHGLPSNCSLEAAPPGLCCEQPKCPHSIVVTIPKGFEKEYPGYPLSQDPIVG